MTSGWFNNLLSGQILVKSLFMFHSAVSAALRRRR